MRKISLLILSAILGSKVYASSGLFLFPNPNPVGTSQSNSNNSGGVLDNNIRNNRNNGRIVINQIRPDCVEVIRYGNDNVAVEHSGMVIVRQARPDRVEVTRYLCDTVAIVRFPLNTLERNNDNLEDIFPNDLIRPRSIGELMPTYFLFNHDEIESIAYNIVNNARESLGTELNPKELNIMDTYIAARQIYLPLRDRIERPQFMNRISLFIDRSNPEVPIAEFLLRRDIEMTGSSRRGIEIFIGLLNEFRRSDVVDTLTPFRFFVTDTLSIDDLTNFIGRLEDNTACGSVNVYPDANPVSGTSIHIDTGTIVITRMIGNTFGPDEKAVLYNFLGLNKQAEKHKENEEDEENTRKRKDLDDDFYDGFDI